MKKLLLILITSLSILSIFFIKDMKIDASPDTLLLKDDPIYKMSSEVDNKYKQTPIMFLSIKTNGNFLTIKKLKEVDKLTKKLKSIKNVEDVTSLTTIPILESSSKSILEIDTPDTLLNPGVDLKKAKNELLKNSIYLDNIVNQDLSAINFIIVVNNNVKETIYEIRQLIEIEKNNWKNIEFGGLQLIKEDIISYVKSDLIYMGTISLLLFLVFIWFVFKNIYYIFYIVFNLVSIVLISSFIMHLLGYTVTVVSSNFVAILMILSLSLSIHLIIRYNENHQLITNKSIKTIKDLLIPSTMVVITTIVGFISLTFANIKPVISFGEMMVIGLIVSLLLSFINFYSIMPNTNQVKHVKFNNSFPLKLFKFQQKNKKLLFGGSFALILITIIGINKISVENSFVNYFKKDSEIFKSLSFLDNNFGGTTPLDIVLKFKQPKEEPIEEITEDLSNDDNFSDFGDSFSDFEEEFAQKEPGFFELNFDQIKILDSIQKKLNDNVYIGKVQSIPMVFDMVRYYKKDKNITPYELEILIKKVNKDIKSLLVYPYYDKETNEYRFNLRIYDSNQDLKRNELLISLEKELKEEFGSQLEYIHITGTMVLYNNLLQSLTSSQVNSFIFVISCMFILFFVMLRNIKQTLILLFINIISVVFILGVIGLSGISLDLMSITIISIALGISVDDSIHYVSRFNKEHKHKGENTQKNVGIAMTLTTIAVIIGFFVMILSNFVPNIYFGLLISLSMIIALLLNLTLLPHLLELNYKKNLK